MNCRSEAARGRGSASIALGPQLCPRNLRELPHASFIGLTGTPIELADANTRAVFGDCVNVYDIRRAYRSRLTKAVTSSAFTKSMKNAPTIGTTGKARGAGP